MLQHYEKMPDANSNQYRLLVSDGVRKTYAILSTKLNYLFEKGIFTKYTIFKVLNYKVETNGKKYLCFHII